MRLDICELLWDYSRLILHSILQFSLSLEEPNLDDEVEMNFRTGIIQTNLSGLVILAGQLIMDMCTLCYKYTSILMCHNYTSKMLGPSANFMYFFHKIMLQIRYFIR